MKKFNLAFVLLALSASTTLFADVIIPSEVIVERNGLSWVWAAPCAASEPSCGAITPLPQNGFDLPTDADWLASFSSYTDVYNAFHVGGQKCASQYFTDSASHDHCDSGDLQSGFIWNSPLAASSGHASSPLAESFLVGRVAAVPEPGSIGLLLSGLAAMGIVGKKRLTRKS